MFLLGAMRRGCTALTSPERSAQYGNVTSVVEAALARSCSNISSETASLPALWDWPTAGYGVLRSCAAEEIVARPQFPLDFPAREALLSMSTAPPGSPPRLASSAGLVVVQASRPARCGSRGEAMANKQTSKQAKSAAKVDTGEANKPAHKTASAQPRRRVSRARSGRGDRDQFQPVAAAACGSRRSLRKHRCRSDNHRSPAEALVHNPSPHRRAPIWRPPMSPVLTLIDRGRAPSARC